MVLRKVHYLKLIIEKKHVPIGERQTQGINNSTGAAEKKNFSKANTQLCVSLITMAMKVTYM